MAQFLRLHSIRHLCKGGVQIGGYVGSVSKKSAKSQPLTIEPSDSYCLILGKCWQILSLKRIRQILKMEDTSQRWNVGAILKRFSFIKVHVAHLEIFKPSAHTASSMQTPKLTAPRQQVDGVVSVESDPSKRKEICEYWHWDVKWPNHITLR